MSYRFTRRESSVPFASEVPDIIASAHAIISSVPTTSNTSNTSHSQSPPSLTTPQSPYGPWNSGARYVHKLSGCETREVSTDTFRTRILGETWFARRTAISDAYISYQDFRNGLLLNHSRQEVSYIHALESATRVHVVPRTDRHDLTQHHGERGTVSMASSMDSGNSVREGMEVSVAGEISAAVEVWWLKYKFSFPTSNRDFVVSIVLEELSDSEFLVISINSTHPAVPKAKGYVRGWYTSIERVRKLPDGKTVEWSMCTTTSPRGMVPDVIANMAMPGQVSADVPSFIQWVIENRQNRK